MPPLPIRLRDQMQVGNRIAPIIAPRGPKPSAAPDPILVSAIAAAPGEALQALGDPSAPTVAAFSSGGFGTSSVTAISFDAEAAGVETGDFIVVALYFGGSPGAIAAPPGWTLLRSTGNGRVYTKIRAASDPDVYTFTWATAQRVTSGFWAGRGCDRIDDDDLKVEGGSGTSHTTADLYTRVPNCGFLLINFNAINSTGNPIAGWTERMDTSNGSTFVIQIQDLMGSANDPGTQGPFSFTSGSLAQYSGVLIALAPTASAGFAEVPIESLQKIVSTSASPAEGGGLVTQSGIFPGEKLQGLAIAAQLAGESSQLLQVLASQPGEWLLPVLAPSGAFAGEALQGVAATDSMPAESLQQLVAARTLPSESSAVVQAVAGEPGEWLLKLIVGAALPGEALQPVNVAVVLPGENAAVVAAVGALAGESSAAIAAVSAALPGEWLTIVRTNSQLTGENLAPLQKVTAIPGESLAPLLVPVLIPLEKLQGLAGVAVLPGEAGSPAATHDVSSLASFPIEILAGVGAVAVLPGEIRTGGVAYRIGVVQLEASELAAVGLEAVPVATAELEAAAVAQAVLVAEPL